MMKRMLPLAAALMMGAVSQRNAAGGGATRANAGGGGGLADLLGGALDRNRAGSALDDIAGMIARRSAAASRASL